MADGILHGKMPYRDLWDFKPPGIFLVYAAAQALLGKSMLAIRALEVAGLVGMVFAFRRLGETFTGERKVGLVGGAVAALTHAQLEFWHTAQPETFGGYLIVLGLMLTTNEPPRRHRVGPLGGGRPSVRFGVRAQAAARRWHRGVRRLLREAPDGRERTLARCRGADGRGGAGEPGAHCACAACGSGSRALGRT